MSHLPVLHPLLPQYKVFEVIVRAQQHRVQYDRTRYRQLDAPEETAEAPVAKDVTRMPQEALVGLEVDGLHAHFQDVGGGRKKRTDKTGETAGGEFKEESCVFRGLAA